MNDEYLFLSRGNCLDKQMSMFNVTFINESKEEEIMGLVKCISK